MNREQLLRSAAQLQPPDEEVQKEYSDHREQLAATLNSLMRARPDIEALVGKNNLLMMEDNHRNHGRFMASLFRAYNPETLVDTVIWVYQAYRAHGFQLTYWPAQLDMWVELLKEALSPEACRQIAPFYEWMIVHQPDFAALSSPDAPA